jgi:hypothetical protein
MISDAVLERLVDTLLCAAAVGTIINNAKHAFTAALIRSIRQMHHRSIGK